MPQVIAFEDVRKDQYRLKDYAWNTPFLKSSAGTPNLPVAFLSQGDLKRCVKPHWHRVDQFQVIVEGNGTLGRHEISPYAVHFTRAYTPYGPLVDDGKSGISFFTLRARFDPGANYVSETKDQLKQVPDRRPWQIARQVIFPSQAAGTVSGLAGLQEIPGIKDDQGLLACSLTMAPDTMTAAPDPSRGDGQYVLVVKGSMWHGDKEHKPYTVVFVAPNDGPFHLHAGMEGLEALVLNFPQLKARVAATVVPITVSELKKWQCVLCAFAYDEAMGLPEEGVPAGTRWEDVPASWNCPDCGASKGDFQMVEVP